MIPLKGCLSIAGKQPLTVCQVIPIIHQHPFRNCLWKLNEYRVPETIHYWPSAPGGRLIAYGVATMLFGPRTCKILAHANIYTLLTAEVRLVHLVVNSINCIQYSGLERGTVGANTLQENRDPGQCLNKDHLIWTPVDL